MSRAQTALRPDKIAHSTAIWNVRVAGRTLPRRSRGHQARLASDRQLDAPPTPTFSSAANYFTTVNVAQSDIRPIVRGELVALDRAIRARLSRGADRMTRLHLQDALERIDRILNPE